MRLVKTKYKYAGRVKPTEYDICANDFIIEENERLTEENEALRENVDQLLKRLDVSSKSVTEKFLEYWAKNA